MTRIIYAPLSLLKRTSSLGKISTTERVSARWMLACASVVCHATAVTGLGVLRDSIRAVPCRHSLLFE